MMTFAEFAECSGCEYSEIKRDCHEFGKVYGYAVHADSMAFTDLGHLYNLSDYRVSSCSAGVYRLIRK